MEAGRRDLVDGFDVGKGDTVEIDGEVHEVAKMRRMHGEGKAVTLVIEARAMV